MPHGVHAKDQTAFRLDPDLRARLKAASEEDGRTMTGAVSEAITEWLDRRDGITTAEPVSPPPRKSRSRPAPVTFKPAPESTAEAEQCPPHPPGRIHKGLCGACGTYVGTKESKR